MHASIASVVGHERNESKVMDTIPSQQLIARGQAIVGRDANLISTLAGQIDWNFASAVEMMMACQGHILITGAGTSASTAARFAHLLSCCGSPALFVHAGDSQHGLAGAVTEKDILVALSKGGRTNEVNDLVNSARKRLAKVIVITMASDSDLARISDVTIALDIPEGYDPFDMIATSSSLMLAALCNAVCETLMMARGYREETFWLIHPGGAVGEEVRRRRVRQVARDPGYA